jgi:hypothetical protein
MLVDASTEIAFVVRASCPNIARLFAVAIGPTQMMRPGGSATDEDLKSPNPFAKLFGGGPNKKKTNEPEKKESSPNWWTLN